MVQGLHFPEHRVGKTFLLPYRKCIQYYTAANSPDRRVTPKNITIIPQNSRWLIQPDLDDRIEITTTRRRSLSVTRA